MARQYVNPNRPPAPGGGTDLLEAVTAAASSHSRALASVRNPKAPAAALDGKYPSLGHFVKAIRDADPKVARLQNAGGLSTRIPSEGGALVPEEFRTDLILYTLEQSHHPAEGDRHSR